MKVVRVIVAPPELGGCVNEEIDLEHFSVPHVLWHAYGSYEEASINWDNHVHQKFDRYETIATVIDGKCITYVYLPLANR